MLLAVCCFIIGLADLEEFPDPPPEVVEGGNFIGPDTLEFWHSKLALPSSFFPELPEHLAAWLDEKQCLIAQPHVYEYFGTWQEAYATNCVQGDFDGAGPNDWAMIIECKGELYLGIFWDGDPERGRVLAFKYLGLALKYLGVDDCRCNYFEEKGIYNGYYIRLVGVSQKELNERVTGRLDYQGYRFEHDGLQLFGDHYYTGRDGGHYQHLYWDGIDWQAFGHGDYEINDNKPTYWEDAWMRDAATLPLIDLDIDLTRDTLSLPPAYFPELPPPLAAWLEQREYRIPQVHDLYIEQFTEGFQKHDRYNVVPGNFDGQGEQDWVVATFRDDTLKVFTCWNADTSSIEQLDISEFDKYQGGYSWCFALDTEVTTFKVITAIVSKEWLNKDISSNLQKIYGDSTELPSEFHHDGIIFERGGDMFDGFVRYFTNDQWIRFYHHEAELRATFDTLLYKKHREESDN